MIFRFLVNPCFNSPCLNGATCSTSGSTYICLCPQFYSGTNCQTCKLLKKFLEYIFLLKFYTLLDTNICLTTPCLNGATCTTTGTGSTYTCTCPTGYLGTNCQTRNKNIKILY